MSTDHQMIPRRKRAPRGVATTYQTLTTEQREFVEAFLTPRLGEKGASSALRRAFNERFGRDLTYQVINYYVKSRRLRVPKPIHVNAETDDKIRKLVAEGRIATAVDLVNIGIIALEGNM